MIYKDNCSDNKCYKLSDNKVQSGQQPHSEVSAKFISLRHTQNCYHKNNRDG